MKQSNNEDRRPRSNRRSSTRGTSSEAGTRPDNAERIDTTDADPTEDSSEEISSALARCEDTVRQYHELELEAGRAMRRISANGLHRERGFSKIETYAESVFGISKQRWYQLTAYARIHGELKQTIESTGVDIPLPQHESQARPLSKFKEDPDNLFRIWKGVVKECDSLTRQNVKRAVKERTENTTSSDQAANNGSPGKQSPEKDASATATSDTENPNLKDSDTCGSDTGESDEADSSSPPESDETSGTEHPDENSGSENPNHQATKGDQDADSDASDGGNASNEGDSSNGEDESANCTGEDSEENTEMEEARRRYHPLLHGVPDGVARSILDIAAAVSDSDDPKEADVHDARVRYEKVAGDRPGDYSFAACLENGTNEIGTSEVLIAMPQELLTSEMAQAAVPVGVPKAQSEYGLPLSYFDGKPPLNTIRSCYEERDQLSQFNSKSVHIDWANYTVNPISGCLHTCGYCYARYQAEDLGRYKQGFQPTFYPGRLLAFSEAARPTDIDHVREKNVFVGSMSDVFGKWVPKWIIESILEEVKANPGFNFLFLTKFPQKLSQFDFPDNAWVGTTVDKQHRVNVAQRHFKQVDASVKWLSCEPMLGPLNFNDLSVFDAVVIGAQQKYGDTPDKQPDFQWVVDLCQDALDAGCEIYFKENVNLNLPKNLPRS